MMANLTNSLLEHGRLKTTIAKAKELRRHSERMITLGKDATLPARRRAMAYLRNKVIVTKLFEEIAPEYKTRNGGYTRIYKIGLRPGDSAPMALIELVEGQSAIAEAAKAATEKAKKPAKKKAVAKATDTAKKVLSKMAGKDEEKPKAKKPAAKKAVKAKPEVKAAAKGEEKPKKAAAKKTTKKETKKED